MTATDSRIARVSSRALSSDCPKPLPTTKNIEISAMRVGNLPLQGTSEFVKIAINRSRGEWIMRQPTTPAALQPKPMHMVSACLPQVWAFWKQWSRLKATRGRYPKSSSRVNSGKKIAIGGSMTETTHASTRQTPSTRQSCSHFGACSRQNRSLNRSCTQNNAFASRADG